MGFLTVRCQRAQFATGNIGAEAAMEWLFGHMEDPDIDAPLDLGGAAGSAAAGGSAMLVSIGFTQAQARKALGETKSVDELKRLAYMIWEANTGRQLGKPLDGHAASVNAIAYSPDGRHLVSSFDDKSIRIWDTNTHEMVMEPLEGHEDWVTAVQYSPDGAIIASAGSDSYLKLWDANTGKCIASIEHPNPVRSISFSPNGIHIATGCHDSLIRVYNVDRHTLVFEPTWGHRAGVQSVQYSPDGRVIASASEDHTVRLWDALTGTPVCDPLEGHRSCVNGVSFSRDGSRLLSCSDDRSIRVWELDGGDTKLKPLYGHDHGAPGVTCSPDGEHFASFAYESVRIWSMRTLEPVLPKILTSMSKIHKPLAMNAYSQVNAISWFPNGKQVAVATIYDTVGIWDMQKGYEICKPLAGHAGSVEDIDISHSGSLLASASLDKTVRVWEVKHKTFVVKHSLKQPSGVRAVCFTPDEARLASGCQDHNIYIWDVRSGSSLHILNGHTKGVTSLSISADGSLLASASDDKNIRIWDLQSYGVVVELADSGDTLMSVCFSHDGSQVLSGSRKNEGAHNTVNLWDLSRRPGETIFGVRRASQVQCVHFSRDGTKFLGASMEEVNVWDANTRELLQSIQHDNHVGAAAFSPDGTQVVSGTDSGEMSLWDVQTGRLLLPKEDIDEKSPSQRVHRVESTDSIMNMPAIPRRRDFIGQVGAPNSTRHSKKKGNTKAFKPNRRGDGLPDSTFDSAEEKAKSRWINRIIPRWSQHITLPVTVSPGRMNPRNVAASSSSQPRPRERLPDVYSLDSHESGEDEHEQQAVWDLQTYAAVAEPLHSGGKVASVCFSPDGAQLLSGLQRIKEEDNAVNIWDLSRGEPYFGLCKGDQWVNCVHFSSDGTKFLSVVGETLEVWDTNTGELYQSIRHDQTVKTAAFSPDGTEIVSGTMEGDIRLWDVETGSVLLPKVEPQYHHFHLAETDFTPLPPRKAAMRTSARDAVSPSRRVQRADSIESFMNMSAVPRHRAFIAQIEGQDGDRCSRKKTNSRNSRSTRRARRFTNSASASGQEAAEPQRPSNFATRWRSRLAMPVVVSPATMRLRIRAAPSPERNTRRGRAARREEDHSDSDSDGSEHENEGPNGLEETEMKVGCVRAVLSRLNLDRFRGRDRQAEENIEMTA
ncbi:WD40 repeat-like protein [Coniophora puteana RWD-64-598 SS2]|uniref:WD40 repeat-like protein n=1 Tax=Coniophora puteana (strain RWD-64-598) TaxID=741705 RepID=A0A5M3MB53_CONPW|nr:WD40 repeat-like protein [Coniophora puteana RWD-64-598 SS2]EIW75845.1 WD40 repeat-like protein [Coniophora puteana RWD-64-598 SS2]